MSSTNEKQQKSLARWRNLIAQCRACNLTVAEFCRQQNLSRHAYYYWHKRIEEKLPADRKTKPAAASFVPLPVAVESLPDAGLITLRLGRVSLDVYENTPEDLLVKTLLALKKVQARC